MAPDSLAFRLLDPIADAFDPLLTLLALLLPRLARVWPGWRPALRHWAAAAAGLGAVYGVRALDARFGLWAAIGADYSTHTAYAVALATTVAAWSHRWVAPMIAAVASYLALVLLVGYHGPLDVATSAAVAGPAAWVARRLLRPA